MRVLLFTWWVLICFESIGQQEQQYTLTTIIGAKAPPDGGPATQSIRPFYFMQKSANEFLILDAAFVWRMDGSGNLTRILGSGTLGVNDPNDDPLTVDLSLGKAAVSASGELFFVDGAQIKKISSSTGKIVLVAGTATPGFADGQANVASFGSPSDIDFGPDGNLYLCDDDNYRIRKLDLTTNTVATIGGTGSSTYNGTNIPATTAGMTPQSVTFDQSGSLVFSDVARIRKITAGTITTIAGNGTTSSTGDGGLATAATVNSSFGGSITSDAQGNIFFSESTIIRKITAATGIVSRYAGTPGISGYTGDGGLATSAKITFANISTDLAGNVYLVQANDGVVRKVAVGTGVITTIAGNGIPGYYSGDGPFTSNTLLSDLWGIAFDANNLMYVTSGLLNRVFRLNLVTNQITTVAGTGVRGFSGDNGLATQATLNSPFSVRVDGAGNVYIADFGNYRIRKVAVGTGVITTIAGTGSSGPFNGENIPATTANMNPTSILLDNSGNLIISDIAGRIRKLDFSTGKVSTIAGNGTGGSTGDGGPAVNASVAGSRFLDITPDNQLYIAETFANNIRKVDLTSGIISRVAGTTTQGFSGDDGPALNATFYVPASVLALEDGNILIADTFNDRLRMIDDEGIITTVAGTGRRGHDGDGDAATHALSIPRAMAVNNDGEIFFTETNGNKIRHFQPGTVTGLGEVAQEDSEVSVYPVPVKTNLTVSARKQEIESVTVLTTAGSPMAQVQVHGSSATIDFRDYPVGIYLVRVEQKNKVTIKKVVHVDR